MALLIFDVDQTLYDSPVLYHERGRSVIHRISEKNEMSYEKTLQVFKTLIEIHSRDGKGKKGTRAAMKLGLTHKEYLDALAEPEPGEFIAENPKLNKALAKLAKKHTLVAFSNSPRAAAEKVVKALGIDQYFSKVYGADSFEEPKPSTKVFRRIAEIHGFKPHEIISVGDNIEKEITPAKSLGADAILCNYRNYSDTEPADVVIDKIEDVYEAVKKLAKRDTSY